MFPGITVIKRNGRREKLNISKIRKYTKASCEGLDGVDYTELELDAKLQFRDGITTEEIQQTLIKTAVDKIDIDRPNWTFVAARLFLYDLYHRVTGFTGYNHLRDYFKKAEEAGRILPGLKEKYNLDDLNSYIKPQRDLQFTYLGIKTLYDRYIIKDKENNPIELPQQLFMGVAMFLAQNETNYNSIPKEDRKHIKNDPKSIRGYWAKKFYDVISKFEVMVATPTLSNARTTRHQLSSCYVGSMNDNIEGIFDDFKEMALLSKYGGGIGWDVSKIRALGSFIDNHKNAAGGVIPWLKIANDIAIAVDQLGTRKGAIAIYLEPWHMDVLDFLDLKKNSGEERRRAHDLFLALWIPDLFMKRVENDELLTLFDPYEVKDLIDLYGEEFEKRYIEYENDPNITKEKIKAKELWKKILLEYYETGNPFLCFKDNANKRNQNKHSGIIRSSNLCVTGDTRLATQFGLVKVKELEEMKEKIIATYDYRTNGDKKIGVGIANCIEMYKTKENADVYEIKTKDGYSIKATNWHEFYVIRDEKIIKIPLKEVKLTDKLMIQSGKGQFGKEGYYELGVIAGLIASNKNLLKDILDVVVKKEFKNKPNDLKKALNEKYKIDKLKVPEFIFRGKEESVRGYLQGVFNDDIKLVSILEEFLKDVQLLLSNFGIRSKISKVDNNYMLEINKSNVINFINEIGFFGKEIKIESIKETFEVEIESIEHIGKEDVYDTTQNYNNSLIFNGIVTGNCTEIFQNTKPNHYKVKVTFKDNTYLMFEEDEDVEVKQGDIKIVKKAKKITSLDTINDKKVYIVEKVATFGETAVCNLASVNLSKVNTPEKIKEVVPIAIRMLDNVIDLNFYPVKKAKDTNLKNRAIGLGAMGEAELLATKGIFWGSEEHFKLIDEIFEGISFYAIKASVELAKEKGSYLEFEGSNWSKGILPIDTANEEAKKLVQKDLFRAMEYDWESLRKEVKKGIRNGYLMAIAPTSSISILTGTTQTIEPVYKKKWYEENLSGLIPVVVPNLNVNTYMFYTSAYELDQKVLVKAAAIRQKWIDQGQSLNIFITTDKASGKYLNDIYMLGWKLGLKSFYYLRSQSPEIREDVIDRSIECFGCQ